MDWIDSTPDLQSLCHPHELDWLPEDATDAQIMDLVSQQFIGRLRQYKTARGARRHLVSRLSLLALLADAEPEIFDSILLEYVEHVSSHP